MTHDATKTNSPDSEDPIDEDDEWEDEEELTLDEIIENHLATIPDVEQYENCVFEGPGVFFTVSPWGVKAMSSDPGYFRGGYFPTIFSGPTEQEKLCINKMMEEFGFDLHFFDMLVEESDKADDAEAIAYFENEADEEEQAVFNKILTLVNSKETPFKSITHFISAVTRYSFGETELSYIWEGLASNLADNVDDAESCLEDFDISKEEWLELLDNLDGLEVIPDNNFWCPAEAR